MKTWKVREYHLGGYNKGNLKEEHYFDTIEEVVGFMNKWYEVNGRCFGLDPTTWLGKNRIVITDYKTLDFYFA